MILVFSCFQGLYEDLNVRISAGTSSHSILTLSGRGFKRLDSHAFRGDHLVHLKIQIPQFLTEEQRELIEEYASLERNTPGTVNKGQGRKKARSAEQRRPEPEPESESEPESEEKKEGFLATLKKKIFG